MASIFDRATLGQSSFVPQFIGSNYKELDDAAALLDQRYRSGVDYTDKIAMMAANELYAEGDQDIKEEKLAQVKQAIANIAASPESFENSSAAISQLARNQYTDPERIVALENAKKIEKDKQLLTQLGASGLVFGHDPYTFKTRGEGKKLNRYEGRIEKAEDTDKKMKDLLGKVEADGYYISPTGEKKTFDETERYMIKSGHVTETTRKKLEELVEGLIPNYKSSVEGDQDIRKLTQLKGYNTDPIKIADGKGYRETNAVDENIRQRFRALAYPQAFRNSQQHIEDFGLSAAERAKQAQENGASFWTGTAPSSVDANTSFVPTLTAEDGDGFTSVDTDSDGNKVYSQYVNNTTGQPIKIEDNVILNHNASSAANIDFMDNYTKVNINPQKAEKDLSASYAKAQEEQPGAFKNYEDYKESYKEASKNHAQITPNGVTLGKEQAGNYDDYIQRNIGSSPLYIPGDASKSVQGLTGLAEKIGTSPDNIEFHAAKVVYDSPRADIPGGYMEVRVTVKDPKAKSHPSTIFVPLNDQFTQLAKPIDHLYKNSFYAGKDTYTMEHPYYPENMSRGDGTKLGFYTTTTVIPKNQQKAGQPGFRTTVHPVIQYPNGSGGVDTVPKRDENGRDEEMSIGAWKQEMIKALSPQFQNALNSGQSFNKKDVKDSGLDY